jgi:hypothetical protein
MIFMNICIFTTTRRKLVPLTPPGLPYIASVSGQIMPRLSDAPRQ